MINKPLIEASFTTTNVQGCVFAPLGDVPKSTQNKIKKAFGIIG